MPRLMTRASALALAACTALTGALVFTAASALAEEKGQQIHSVSHP